MRARLYGLRWFGKRGDQKIDPLKHSGVKDPTIEEARADFFSARARGLRDVLGESLNKERANLMHLFAPEDTDGPDAYPREEIRLPSGAILHKIDYDNLEDPLVQKLRLMEFSPATEFARFYWEARSNSLTAGRVSAMFGRHRKRMRYVESAIDRGYSGGHSWDERVNYSWLGLLVKFRLGWMTKEHFKRELLIDYAGRDRENGWIKKEYRVTEGLASTLGKVDSVMNHCRKMLRRGCWLDMVSEELSFGISEQRNLLLLDPTQWEEVPETELIEPYSLRLEKFLEEASELDRRSSLFPR